MRNKTISKILIAAGLVTVVGAGVYGTSHNTNNKVAFCSEQNQKFLSLCNFQ